MFGRIPHGLVGDGQGGIQAALDYPRIAKRYAGDWPIVCESTFSSSAIHSNQRTNGNSEFRLSIGMTTTYSPAVNTADNMIAQLESKSILNPHHLPELDDSSSIDFVTPSPARVPEEMPSTMRRQPTPDLIVPFRWAGWTRMRQAILNAVRVTRLSLGSERD